MRKYFKKRQNRVHQDDPRPGLAHPGGDGRFEGLHGRAVTQRQPIC